MMFKLYMVLTNFMVPDATDTGQGSIYRGKGGGGGMFSPQTPLRILPIELEIKRQRVCWHSLYCENNNCTRVSSEGLRGPAFAYSNEYSCLTGCVNSQHATIVVCVLGSFSTRQLTLTTQNPTCQTAFDKSHMCNYIRTRETYTFHITVVLKNLFRAERNLRASKFNITCLYACTASGSVGTAYGPPQQKSFLYL